MYFNKNLSINGSILSLLCAGFLLSACGSDKSADQNLETNTSIESQVPTAEAKPESPDSRKVKHIINAFTFTVNPDIKVHPTPDAQNLRLAGGCAGDRPLSIGFNQGSHEKDDYFYLAFDSAAPIASGQTGETKLADIRWDNGSIEPDNLPAGSGVMVPNRFTGTGVLTINSHTGAGHAGQMSGEIQGDLENQASGDTVSVLASFDINLACGQ